MTIDSFKSVKGGPESLESFEYIFILTHEKTGFVKMISFL